MKRTCLYLLGLEYSTRQIYKILHIKVFSFAYENCIVEAGVISSCKEMIS